MKKTLLICLALYSLTLGILLFNALANGIISDRITEYQEYINIIQQGGWSQTHDSLVNSSIIATLLPAKIQLITGWDAVILFKIFPCFFYALVPIFVFLIARRYLDDWQAILCALFMLSQFNMLHNSNMGRVSIGLGIFAVFAWALLSKRYLLLVISGVLLILSHYGTTAIAVFIGGVTLVGLIIKYRRKVKEYLKLAVIGLLLIGMVGIWYFGFAQSTGKYVQQFVAVITTSTISFPIDIKGGGGEDYQIEIAPEQEYELTIQYAFGQKWSEMNYYQKLEWGICWSIILSLLGGIIWAVRRGVLRERHQYMAVAVLIVIAVPLFIPWVSTHYGVVRAYLTALMVIAPFFVYGLVELSKKLHINQYILPCVLIGLNALVVTGAAPPYLWGLID